MVTTVKSLFYGHRFNFEILTILESPGCNWKMTICARQLVESYNDIGKIVM